MNKGIKMDEYESLPKREKTSPVATMLKDGVRKYAEEDSRHYWRRNKFKRAKTKAQRPRYTIYNERITTRGTSNEQGVQMVTLWRLRMLI